MRIAIISNILPPAGLGGAEAYAALLATTLAARHEVTVLSGATTTDLGDVEHVRLPALPSLPHDAHVLRKSYWHLRDQWLPEVHLATTRAFDRFRPDVVHTHEPQGLSAAVFTAIGSRQLAHVHTAHDLNLMCVRASMTRDGRFCGGRCSSCGLQRRIRGSAMKRRIDCLIAVSDFIRDRHLAAGIISRERSTTIRLGAEGTPRQRVSQDGRLRLGFIGRVSPYKGVPTLVQWFERSAAASWTLSVAGTGPSTSLVEEAARRDSRITSLGQIERSAREAFFDSIDVLIIPSEWEEPAALVAYEAAVRGIPAVVSNRGGLPEAPEASVFRAGDPSDLGRTDFALAESGALAAASERLVAAHESFHWRGHSAIVENVLTAAAAEHGRSFGRG